MFLTVLAAAALASMNGAPDACASKSPNYSPASVQVASVNNPSYSFPGVGNQTVMNGRIFKGRPIIGSAEMGSRTDAAHAAASYGAFGDEGTRVQAPVEGLVRYHPTTTVEFSPWSPVPQQQASPASDPFSRAHQKMAHRAEEARQQWLKDNNYVGGVRTFVNDAVLYNLPAAKPQTQNIEPRGVIELNPEVPAFKSRMKVEAKPTINMPKVAMKSTAPKVLPKTTAVASKPEQSKTEKADVKVAQK